MVLDKRHFVSISEVTLDLGVPQVGLPRLPADLGSSFVAEVGLSAVASPSSQHVHQVGGCNQIVRVMLPQCGARKFV